MSITTSYVYTDNGVDSTGTNAASGGNFTFYGNTGGTLRGWFITFPTAIPNVTEVDFSTLGTSASDSIGNSTSFGGTMRFQAYTTTDGGVTTDTTTETLFIGSSGGVLITTIPVITLDNATLTGVAILGKSGSGGANFNFNGVLTEGVNTYDITTSPSLTATMYTHLADLTWTSVVGATNYTITQIEDGGVEEIIVSETTELSHTALDLNPGSSYEFTSYSDLDLLTPVGSVTESAPVVNTANVTAITTRLSNDFTTLSLSSYDELEAELRNFLTTGDEVVLSSGDAVYVNDSETLTQIQGKDILTPFESTAGSGQTATITTLGGDSSVLTYDESLNEITSDATAYSVGSYFIVGSYKVRIEEI